MTRAEKAVLKLMHERGEATRPQLAAATGLSLVTVGKAVAVLSRRGEIYAVGEVPSAGGRPVQLYRYHAGHALHALIEGKREGNLLRCELTLMDLHGAELKRRTASFAYLDVESLDGMLDEMLRGKRLRSITLLQAVETLSPQALVDHLSNRYRCCVNRPCMASLLADKTADNTATICLPQSGVPSCSMYRRGELRECGPLHYLPMPADWATLDYGDRSLLEEMIARLLVIITCTHSPEHIILYAEGLTDRLIERIRYNAATKLRDMLPPLNFATLTQEFLHAAVLNYCTDYRHD